MIGNDIATADSSTRYRPSRAAGFTLIELMVVIAIVALAAQLVVSNLGSVVPETVLNSEATRIVGDIEFIRSEARLQGKSYRIELDLDLDRWRIVLPPEERLTSLQTIEESIPLNWQDLDARLMISGHALLGQPAKRDGRSAVLIDPNGFTADQSLFLTFRNESSRDLVWTIQMRGLEQRVRILKNRDGLEELPPVVEEFAFR